MSIGRIFFGAMLGGVLMVGSATGGELGVWAVGEGVRINPMTGRAFEENAKMLPGGVSGDYRAKNWVVFVSRIHGACQWSFLEGAKSGDTPWTTGGSPKNPGDALFMYPGDEHGMPDTVFPSMRLKAYRRGMQDYECLHAVAAKDGKDAKAMAFATRAASRPMTGKLDMKDFQDDASHERATVKVAGGDLRSWPHHPEAFEKVGHEMGAYLGGAAAR